MDTETPLHTPPTTTHRNTTTLRRMIATLGVSALLFAACGQDEEPVSIGSDSIEEADSAGDDDRSVADIADDLTAPIVDPDLGTGSDVEDQLTAEAIFADAVSGDVARDDIMNPELWTIESAVASEDDNMLVVTYTAGHPPCTQAFAEVLESDDAVKVSLMVGLHPNVAAMTCPAAEMQDEISVELNSPVGDRTIEITQP